jgi:hypothetical protein
MIMDFEKSLDVFHDYLKFLKIIAKQMIGKTKNIIIDTGINSHYNENSKVICSCCDCSYLDESKDLITIKGNEKKVISFDDVYRAFNKIKNQLDTLNKSRCDKPDYFFHSLEQGDDDKNTFYIMWSTESK